MSAFVPKQNKQTYEEGEEKKRFRNVVTLSSEFIRTDLNARCFGYGVNTRLKRARRSALMTCKRLRVNRNRVIAACDKQNKTKHKTSEKMGGFKRKERKTLYVGHHVLERKGKFTFKILKSLKRLNFFFF